MLHQARKGISSSAFHSNVCIELVFSSRLPIKHHLLDFDIFMLS